MSSATRRISTNAPALATTAVNGQGPEASGFVTSVAASPWPRRLNIGCGTDIRPGWCNLDLAQLNGVDVVHDLNNRPWPFADRSFDEVEMIDILEHLPDTVGTMEELHRICAPGAKVVIQVPYWNSPDAISDPTHRRNFDERSFNFFDPSTPQGKKRSYYSTARFHIARRSFFIRIIPGLPYLKVTMPGFTHLMAFFAHHFCGVIWVEEFELIALHGDALATP